jgi:hypothetical protein
LPAPLNERIVTDGERLSDKNPPQSACVLAGMTMKEFHVPRGMTALVAATAIAFGFVLPATAQQAPPHAPQPPPAPVMSYAKSRPAAPPGVARYEDLATQRSFTLDLSGEDALMKFDDSPEVYALRATTAQRGDTFLRSDAGELMLRVTEQDNVISYLGDKDGAPADIAGAAPPLASPPMTVSFTQGLKDSAQRLSRLAGHDVTIFGTAEFASSEDWIADALMVMVFGVERANSVAPKSAEKLQGVRILRAKSPQAVFKDGQLLLGVNPAEGYAGRPSSEAIANAMLGAR